MGHEILSTEGLTKRYGEALALDQVSISVNEGEVYGLVGRNGAGKTTLLKCIMGLARPDTGGIAIGAAQGSQSPAALAAARRQVGLMLSPAFYPYLSGRENLRYLCHAKGIKAADEPSRLLELVGLPDDKKPFRAYSQGMRQRLGIAGALLGSPRIVILDEPANGLDPQGIVELRQLIKQVNEQEGTSFIISSHILSELEQTATCFGFIEQGRLLKQLSRQELASLTRSALIVEVDDPKRARIALAALGISDVQIEGRRLTLSSQPVQAADIARQLVAENIGINALYQQETTLEQYFISLLAGAGAPQGGTEKGGQDA